MIVGYATSRGRQRTVGLWKIDDSTTVMECSMIVCCWKGILQKISKNDKKKSQFEEQQLSGPPSQPRPAQYQISQRK